MRVSLLIILLLLVSVSAAAQESTAEPTPPVETPMPTLEMPTPASTPTPDTRVWIPLTEENDQFGALDLTMTADTSFLALINLVELFVLLAWFVVWLMRESKR